MVILAVLWALVLLPGAFRSRRRSPRSTVGGFEHAMGALAHHRGSQGREVMVPNDANRIVTGLRSRGGVIERRRRAFTSLIGAAGTTLLLALLVGGAAWLLFTVSAGALGAYVSLLLRFKTQRREASRVVRELVPQDTQRDEFERRLEVDQRREPARAAVGAEGYGGLQVATRPDDPWEPQSGVRIRRWDP